MARAYLFESWAFGDAFYADKYSPALSFDFYVLYKRIDSMAKIYHYTDIGTLALILHNRTIRFNRLDRVDDPDEFDFEQDGLHPAGYCFVSCWTRNQNESLPQWSMYGHGNHGVRIGLEEDMFPLYSYQERTCFVSFEDNLKRSDFVICPNSTSNERSITDILYVDDPTNYRHKIIGYTGDTSFVNFNELGVYKSKDWAFQKECRIMMTIIPKITTQDTPCKSIKYAFEHNIPLDISFYDLELKCDVYQGMEILLGPSISESERLIVKSLMMKYLNRENCLTSKYAGKTK